MQYRAPSGERGFLVILPYLCLSDLIYCSVIDRSDNRAREPTGLRTV